MKVYAGEYELTLTNVTPSDVELSDILVDELSEMLQVAGTLRCSPVVRDMTAKAAATLEQMRGGKAWADLDLAEQFNARVFRSTMRKHARTMSEMIVGTST